jgi:hypothetical protein
MNTVKKLYILRSMFFILLAAFFLSSSNSVVAASPNQFSAGLVKKQKAPMAEVESEAVDEAGPEMSERAGTVDAVDKDCFVIDDSTVWLTESVLFFDRYGKRTSKDAFTVGDRVLVTRSEDRDGTVKLVSLSLMKPVKKSEKAGKKTNPPQGQSVKKVNGVWVN